MSRIRIKTLGEGQHPNERMVSVTTASGERENVMVDYRSIKDDTIDVGYPIANQGDQSLVELPRETTTGQWRGLGQLQRRVGQHPGMILTDREIKLALQQNTLIIDPKPLEVAYGSTSVDLTLDPTVSEFLERKTDRHFDPGRPGYPLNEVLRDETRRIDITTRDRYELAPSKLILAWTAEYVDLRKSPRLAARVEGKS